MATKKLAASPPADVPAVLTAAERNKSLGRMKASLAKTWSLSRAESLVGAAHLAWFLVALGREPEARALAEHVADAVPRDAAAPVSAAASAAIALAARLARLRGDEARRAMLLERLAVSPAHSGAAAMLAEADKDVRSAEVDPSVRHACLGLARGCARAATLREAGAPDLDLEAVERIISQGLDGLRAQLHR
ncbi:MAG: hypothetical protein NVS3B10_27140 [Polyangiales bacterium]